MRTVPIATTAAARSRAEGPRASHAGHPGRLGRLARTSARRLAPVAVAVLAAPLLFTAPASASSGTSARVFLDSAVAVDTAAGTVTLPLYEGRHDGERVWYVVTESSDGADAARRGVSRSSALANALGTRAVQAAPLRNGLLDFTGTVDFSPERVVVPGAGGFPPAVARAGAVGDADYSPLVTSDGKIVLNASQVANASGQHDAIVAIDFAARTVTLDTLNGFHGGQRVQYLHQEASVELVAALEGSTLTPNLDAAPGLARFGGGSARAAIIPVVNGVRGVGDPQRQGLQSAVLGEGDPRNVTQVVPNQGGYTPVWDVSPVVWTQSAIDRGLRVQLRDSGAVADAFAHGLLVSGGGGPANDSLKGVRALPGISNCPVVVQLGPASSGSA